MTGPSIENHVHGGRGLVGFDEDGGFVVGWPELAYESIRAINHLTSGPEPVPAPTLYRVLGDLKMVGHLLPQGLEQLSNGLERSLQELDVYDRRSDPAESVAEAQYCLRAAMIAAARVGHWLEKAQTAIAEQGYRTPEESHEAVRVAPVREVSRRVSPAQGRAATRSVTQ